MVREVSLGRRRVQLQVPSVQTLFRCRRFQLQSAISNLLDNAEQHALSESSVEARLWCDRKGIHFVVSNHGAALSSVRLARMWQRFYTTRGDEGGSGLGLAIVKSAVEAHGGTVVAHCSGEETSVGFFLPV